MAKVDHYVHSEDDDDFALRLENTTGPVLDVLLEARGYSRDDIAKIWSGNLLRVWREVESTAARLAAAPR